MQVFDESKETKPVNSARNYHMPHREMSQISCSIHASWERLFAVGRYVEREFPEAADGGNAVHSVPSVFQRIGGERQANLAEQLVFARLHGLAEANDGGLGGLWMTFFHSASYAGRSFRNHRDGKLMIREHDFVIFARYRGKWQFSLICRYHNNAIMSLFMVQRHHVGHPVTF